MSCLLQRRLRLTDHAALLHQALLLTVVSCHKLSLTAPAAMTKATRADAHCVQCPLHPRLQSHILLVVINRFIQYSSCLIEQWLAFPFLMHMT